MVTKQILQRLFNYDPHSGEFASTVSGELSGFIVEARHGVRYVKISILGKEYYAPVDRSAIHEIAGRQRINVKRNKDKRKDCCNSY